MYLVNEISMAQCIDCGLLQMQRHLNNWELRAIYSADYFDRGKYVDDFAGQREHRRRLSLMRKAGLAPGSRVLDFGTATGEFANAASEHYEVWGSDINADGINAAARNYPALANRLMINQALRDLDNEFFDALVLWDVLEHLDDPLGSLTEILRLLKAGGILAVSTPNVGSLIAKLMSTSWHFMTPPEHIALFDKTTLHRLFEQLGLKASVYTSLGKWVNARFLVGKLHRTFPNMLSRSAAERIVSMLPEKVPLYIPTGDVQYLLGRKLS